MKSHATKAGASARRAGNKTGARHIASSPIPAKTRVAEIDVLRGSAIILMVIYHICYDLRIFGVTSADFEHDALWLGFRAFVVSFFSLLVGISLVLARSTSFARRRRRIVLIAVCAAIVTLGSYISFPKSFIYFGILHFIAVASLLAWPLLRYPRAAALLGTAVIVAGLTIKSSFFDQPWLNWIGFMTHKPVTGDYVPMFPWFGVVLLGIGLGHAFVKTEFRWLRPLARFGNSWVAMAGRRSLLIYMLHQPLLLGLLWLVLGRW